VGDFVVLQGNLPARVRRRSSNLLGLLDRPDGRHAPPSTGSRWPGMDDNALADRAPRPASDSSSQTFKPRRRPDRGGERRVPDGAAGRAPPPPRRRIRRRARDLLAQVGLAGKDDVPARPALPGGQRQRVAIARGPRERARGRAPARRGPHRQPRFAPPPTRWLDLMQRLHAERGRTGVRAVLRTIRGRGRQVPGPRGDASHDGRVEPRPMNLWDARRPAKRRPETAGASVLTAGGVRGRLRPRSAMAGGFMAQDVSMRLRDGGDPRRHGTTCSSRTRPCSTGGACGTARAPDPRRRHDREAPRGGSRCRRGSFRGFEFRRPRLERGAVHPVRGNGASTRRPRPRAMEPPKARRVRALAVRPVRASGSYWDPASARSLGVFGRGHGDAASPPQPPGRSERRSMPSWRGSSRYLSRSSTTGTS